MIKGYFFLMMVTFFCWPGACATADCSPDVFFNCPGACDFADLSPVTFFACPGGSVLVGTDAGVVTIRTPGSVFSPGTITTFGGGLVVVVFAVRQPVINAVIAMNPATGSSICFIGIDLVPYGIRP